MPVWIGAKVVVAADGGEVLAGVKALAGEEELAVVVVGDGLLAGFVQVGCCFAFGHVGRIEDSEIYRFVGDIGYGFESVGCLAHYC